MNSERAALLRRVIDEPNEDAPRLIYADWLEEYGCGEDGSRAEFIRVQIELTRRDLFCDRWMYSCGETIPTIEKLARDGCPRCRRWASLTLRERELFRWDAIGELGAKVGGPGDKHFGGWHVMNKENTTYEIRDGQYDRAPRLSFRWRRGFVEEIREPLAALLDHGPHILREHPVTRMVATDREPDHEEDNLRHWYAGDHDEPDTLPLDLFRKLPASEGGSDWASTSRKFALDCLSAALLALCREAALTRPAPP